MSVNTPELEIGSVAEDFFLLSVDDRKHTLQSLKGNKGTVIVFICNHCPYVKAVLKRLIDLQNEFSGRGVQMIGINPNDATRYPEDSLDNMKLGVKEKGISFPYLIDPSQEIAKKYSAVCTYKKSI